MSKDANQSDPSPDCPLCPRLVAFRENWRNQEPDWHNAPVETWLESDPENVQLLITGLAPGLRGANRTGRPFTGDFAGDLLYATLLKFGYAVGEYGAASDDSLTLRGAAITNAVRCVPPENKPVGSEIANCRPFLTATLERFPNLRVVVPLGKIAHDSTVRALGGKLKEHPFGHGNESEIAGLTLLPSYHCSRYNTNTGRLTAEMFEAIFERATRIAAPAKN